MKSDNWEANVFLFFSIIFGLLLVFLTPPFQSPDEDVHFYRAYQISEGHIIPTKLSESKLGGYLPSSLEETVKTVSSSIKFNTDTKQDLYDLLKGSEIQLQKEKRNFLDFPNTALYSPMNYLPQAMGILLGRVFNLPVLYIFYLGRITTLATWIAVIYYAIKIIPYFRKVFLLLSLMPMPFFLAASLSGDNMVNATSLLYIAILLYVVHANYQIDSQAMRKWVATLILLGLVIALLKTGYVLLLLLIFLIPISKYSSLSKFFIYSFAMILPPLVLAVVWSLIANKLYVPIRAVSSTRDQIAFILDDPVRYLHIVKISLIGYRGYIIEQLVGRLGWLDTPISEQFRSLYLVVLVFFAIVGRTYLNLWQRIILFSVSVLLSFILVTLVYFSWSAVGALNLEGIQGRYFFTVFLLLLLSIGGIYEPKIRNIYFNLLAICMLSLSVYVTVSAVLLRYYL